MGDRLAKTMGVARFKEQCLALIDALDAEGIVITKHGKPVRPTVCAARRWGIASDPND